MDTQTLRQKIIDKLAWIHIVEGRILMTLSKGKDVYYIPGGKREQNETDAEALIREIREELTVDLHYDTLAFLGKFEAQAHGEREGVLVRMTCYTGEFSGQIEAASEIAEVVWFNHRDKDRSSPADQLIFDWLKAKNLLR